MALLLEESGNPDSNDWKKKLRKTFGIKG